MANLISRPKELTPDGVNYPERLLGNRPRDEKPEEKTPSKVLIVFVSFAAALIMGFLGYVFLVRSKTILPD